MKPSMLICGHGTRRASGVAAFDALVTRVRGAAQIEVAGGFIELSRPPLSEAVAELYRAGSRHLVAVPLMLISAGHGKGDIPAALRREAARHPGLTYSYGRPLGPHPTLLNLLERRIDVALAGLTGDSSGDCGSGGDWGAGGDCDSGGDLADRRDGTVVILAGQGSTDPDGNAELAKVARLLWEGRGYASVEVAYLSTTVPGPAAALDRALALGAKRLVLAPYLLFPGVLADFASQAAAELAARHPEVEMAVAEPLGDSPELASLVIERYQEALAGDIRMNCDTCLYRVPFPNLAHRVGAPQLPHHHPDDHPGHHDHHDHHEQRAGR